MHKREEAEEALRQDLGIKSWDEINQENIQSLYDFLEETIKKVMVKYGKNKKQLRTDDKLSTKTTELISKRAEIRKKVNLSLSLIHISEPTRPY